MFALVCFLSLYCVCVRVRPYKLPVVSLFILSFFLFLLLSSSTFLFIFYCFPVYNLQFVDNLIIFGQLVTVRDLSSPSGPSETKVLVKSVDYTSEGPVSKADVSSMNTSYRCNPGASAISQKDQLRDRTITCSPEVLTTMTKSTPRDQNQFHTKPTRSTPQVLAPHWKYPSTQKLLAPKPETTRLPGLETIVSHQTPEPSTTCLSDITKTWSVPLTAATNGVAEKSSHLISTLGYELILPAFAAVLVKLLVALWLTLDRQLPWSSSGVKGHQ